MDIFHRYYPQFKALSDVIDEFNIIYLRGDVKEEWKKDFKFKRVIMLNTGNNHLTYLLNCRNVWNQIKHIDYDINYCLSGIWFQWYSSNFADFGNKPFVIRLRGDDRLVRIIMKQNKIKRWFFERLNDVSFQNADLIIPITKDLNKVALSYGVDESKIHEPIFNGINSELFNPMKKVTQKFTLGFVGRISKEKGSDFLELLCKCLYKLDPEIQINICGEIQDDIYFYDNVDYWGKIDYKDMPNFYATCDVIMLPSYTEGFPNIILESYLMQKPIICSEFAIPSDIELFGLKLSLCLRKWVDAILDLKRCTNLDNVGIIASDYVYNTFSWDLYSFKMKNALMSVL